jgi:hypothetical protein
VPTETIESKPVGRGVGLAAAGEAVAERFTRPMRAATSRYGAVTDPPLVCAAIAAVVVVSVIVYNLGVIGRAELPFVYAAVALPVVVALAAHLGLAGARARVVAWLAALPFPLENVNALLNGVGQNLVVRFVANPPEREALNRLLEQVHEDCFALEFHPDEPEVEVRIGVVDSKLNPAGAAHRRYQRVRDLVDRCLVTLAADHPIAWVRVA